jgi:hypothetical protein
MSTQGSSFVDRMECTASLLGSGVEPIHTAIVGRYKGAFLLLELSLVLGITRSRTRFQKTTGSCFAKDMRLGHRVMQYWETNKYIYTNIMFAEYIFERICDAATTPVCKTFITRAFFEAERNQL